LSRAVRDLLVVAVRITLGTIIGSAVVFVLFVALYIYLGG